MLGQTRFGGSFGFWRFGLYEDRFLGAIWRFGRFKVRFRGSTNLFEPLSSYISRQSALKSKKRVILGSCIVHCLTTFFEFFSVINLP